jgi:hypothetical protein
MTPRPRTALPADLESVRALLTDNKLPLERLERAWLTVVTNDAGGVIGCVALERHIADDRPVFN